MRDATAATPANGIRTETVLTDNIGLVQGTVPRQRDGTFEPQLVGNR